MTRRHHISGPHRRRAAASASSLLVTVLALPTSAFAAAATLPADEDPVPPVPRPAPMEESLRGTLQRIVVVPRDAATEDEIKGSYEQATMGVYGGMAAGSAAATPNIQVGPVNVNFPIPVLALPGMLAGGVVGATQREIQEFRDALTEEVATASNQPLSNEKLARAVYQSLRTQPKPAAGLLAANTAVPAGTDAILRIDIPGMSIDVDGSDAVLATAGHLYVERASDQSPLYERTVVYRDRAALSDWVDDDHRLLTDYTNYALHYLGRELAAAAVEGTDIAAEFQPAGSDSVTLERKNPWQGESRVIAPTLAWTAVVTDAAAAVPVSWDLEVYDAHRPVYTQRGIRTPSHALVTPLAACGHYRWSVRPAYEVGGEIRYGAWMRRPVAGEEPPIDGLSGRDAAAAPAYTQDFAGLDISCKAK